MKKFILIAAVGVLVILGAVYLTWHTVDYKSATYQINGANVVLTNGMAQTPAAPGSAAKITTKYFGNEAQGDFDGDGSQDVAFLLTQDGGGSGTFFYVVTALKKGGGYQGTNAILLGDRIAPQTTEFRDGKIVVNYVDRSAEEPMTTAPHIGVSR